MALAHEAVSGMTRSGKSFYAAAAGRKHPGPLIVIDPQDSPCWFWPRADKRNSAAEVIAAAKGGGVVYVPSWDDRQGRAEVALLAAEVVEAAKASGAAAGRGNRAWLMIFDEAQVYAPEGGRPGGLHQVARQGLRWGVRAIFVSQRPADIAKAVCSQAERHTIFEPGAYGAPYFDKYGIDAQEVRRLLDDGRRQYAHRAADGRGPWPFVQWEKGRLSGPLHL